MISTLYRVQHTYINLFNDDFHDISWKKHTYNKVNPFHDDTCTTAHEKYQFTCSVVFSATEPSWKGLISVTE